MTDMFTNFDLKGKEDIATIVGIFAILLVLAYLAVHLMKTYVYAMKTVEGFVAGSGYTTNAKNYGDQIKTNTSGKIDSLQVLKYRSDYEHIIMNMDDNFNAQMFNLILSIGETSNDDEYYNVAQKLATYKIAKDGLNNVMTYIDKQ